MRLTRKINNNVAMAVDGLGKEIVVFGRGVGFPAMPYELNDLSRVQRMFFDVGTAPAEPDEASLQEGLARLAAEVAEMARAELACSFNPHLPMTLADYLSFAIDRYKNGAELRLPLACDLEHFYPAEMSLARRALKLLRERLGVVLPQSEAANLALQLIGGEMEHSDLRATLSAMQVIEALTQIIEKTLHVQPDTACIIYSRFVLCIRYMLENTGCVGQKTGGVDVALEALAAHSPEVYDCALRVREYLVSSCHLSCGPDEMLYLFLHINRLRMCSAGQEKAGPSGCAPTNRKERKMNHERNDQDPLDGGAVGVMLGASGNSPIYDSYLADIGAAQATDDIFIVLGYCPITNLDSADAGYEWFQAGNQESFLFNAMAVDMYGNDISDQITVGRGNFHPFGDNVLGGAHEDELAAKLYDWYVGYIQGYGFDLGDDGRSGAYFTGLVDLYSEGLTQWLTRYDELTTPNKELYPDAAAYVQHLYDDFGAAERLSLAEDGVTATITDYDVFMGHFINRNKMCPSLDSYNKASNEGSAFVDADGNRKHFSVLVRDLLAEMVEEYRDSDHFTAEEYDYIVRLADAYAADRIEDSVVEISWDQPHSPAEIDVQDLYGYIDGIMASEAK